MRTALHALMLVVGAPFVFVATSVAATDLAFLIHQLGETLR